MADSLHGLLSWLTNLPPVLLYAILGAAAALENIVPPIPADVVVVFGGLLAARGGASVWLVFAAVWACNVGGALAVYFAGRRFGAGFFAGRWGKAILRPNQLHRLGEFYRRYGLAIIFVSRFLPMFRAVVPVFAGVSGVGFFRTAVPVAAASGLWYGMLVYLGSVAGRNLEQILEGLSSAGRWLWLVALVVGAAVGWWWWRSR